MQLWVMTAPLIAALVCLEALALPASPRADDAISYCNAVQNRVGFIRYPLGTVGAWSTSSGEMADVMTRAPRVYPTLNSVVVRGPKEDWRASISGDPSLLVIKYQTNQPPGGAITSITVSPHVSIFKIAFPERAGKKHVVFDFSRGNVDTWARLNQWTNRTVTQIDARTLMATVGQTGKSNVFYVIKFSEPCVGSGTIDSSGADSDRANRLNGSGVGRYARFEAATVTVAVAESFTSAERAGQFLAEEFTDFEAAQRRCHKAWEQVLGKVEIEGSDNSKRMAYTALYTMYANIIDGSDGSCYTKFYPRPRSLASSAYWQFIGGFQSCCWDNVRAAYPFLMLTYPDAMTDILNTYLARHDRDGVMSGNGCLFTGLMGNLNIRFSPSLVAQAQASGLPLDYPRFYDALKEDFNNETNLPSSLSRLGYLTQPAAGGFACSQTLEFATGLHSLALLAKANHDEPGFQKCLRLSKSYANLWDSTDKVFRVKNPDGSWGPIKNTNMTWNPNPEGLFEGTTKDWMFAVPHDPYGLIGLPGQEGCVERVTAYCLNDTWFNDYQYIYPYLLYYAGAPNRAQRILRASWIPMFETGIMYEGVRPKLPHNGWQDHYTSNSGWLLCSMLGLYPVPSPPGQFIISSSAIEKAVIHTGTNAITLQTHNNQADNIYIRSIKLDGKPYPCYLLPACRLVAGTRLDLEMGNDPERGLGDLYISSADGLILSAELISASHLKYRIEAAASEPTSKVRSRAKPSRILLNGLEHRSWNYDEPTKTITIISSGISDVEVFL